MFHNTFDEYQAASAETDRGTPRQMPKVVYLALAVNGEAGELAEEVKKLYRDDDGILTSERRNAMISEGGDVLWYLSRFCDAVGISLAEMAHRNTAKLQGREERGTIQGSGDNR